jgi:hypothetical protein
MHCEEWGIICAVKGGLRHDIGFGREGSHAPTGQVNNPFFNSIPGTRLHTRTIARQKLLRPFPQFLDINSDEPVGYSWYHALQSRVERRFMKGFTPTGTWSKFMEAMSYLNPTDACAGWPRQKKGVSHQSNWMNRLILADCESSSQSM